nr:actin isoform X6 [Symphalangus syndactylus]
MDSVPLICDYGSGFSKVGFAGMESPMGVFPTVLGKLQHDNVLVGMEEEDWFIGEEVQKKRGKLNVQYPISRATTTNWDNMEKIWHHSFYQVLHVAPEQHPMLVTEPPLNPTPSKEKVTQVLFETFNIPALYLANQGVLSLYASGQTSGMTVESGEGMTHFVPIADGCPLHQSTFQVDIAGQDLTLYLLQLLKDNGQLLVGTGGHLSIFCLWSLGRWLHLVFTLHIQGYVGHQQGVQGDGLFHHQQKKLLMCGFQYNVACAFDTNCRMSLVVAELIRAENQLKAKALPPPDFNKEGQ